MENIFNHYQESWLTELESTEVGHTTGTLWAIWGPDKSFCCLGIAMELLDSSSEQMTPNTLNRNFSAGADMSMDVRTKLQLNRYGDPRVKKAMKYPGIEFAPLTRMNDRGTPFKEIASWLRKYPDIYFDNFDLPS